MDISQSCSWRQASGMLAGLLVVGSLGFGSAWSATPVAAAPVDSTAPVAGDGSRGLDLLRDEQAAMIRIIHEVTPAVVHVEAQISASDSSGGGGGQIPLFPFGPDSPSPSPHGRSGPGLASGSGIIIDPNGTIVTNRHVVEGASNVQVTLTDHRIFRGKVYSDPNIDLAVIKVNATDLPSVQLEDTSDLHIGQFTLAIGYPFDVGQTVTRGIISALGRSQTIEGKFYPDLIQTDASINPGNSGGALVDLNGRVIGVNTAIAGEAGQSAGIGFAIPASAVQLVAPQLANAPHTIKTYPPGWRRGKLGVEVKPVTPDLAAALGVTEGALVAVVQPDSPAAKAGIQAGDVITKVTSATVNEPIRDADELVNAISDVGPNQSVVLTVIRAKKTMTRTVITGSFNETTASTTTPNGGKLGLSVTTLTADMRTELKLPGDVHDGAVVTNVATGTPAEAGGFQQGDVIVSVNGNAVHSAEDYSAAVAAAMGAAKPGDSIGMQIYRGNTEMFLSVQVPEGSGTNQ